MEKKLTPDERRRLARIVRGLRDDLRELRALLERVR